MKRLLTTGLRVAASFLAFAGFSARAEEPALTFKIELNTNFNSPTLTLTNTSQVEIERMFLTIGHTQRHFDATGSGSFRLVGPPGGNIAQPWPNNSRDNDVRVDFTDFGPGEAISVDLDIDGGFIDPPNAPAPNSLFNTTEDYRNVFWNNGSEPNATLTVISGARTEVFTFPDTPPANADSSYTFKAPARRLTVKSVAETNGQTYVRVVQVKQKLPNGTLQTLEERIGEEWSRDIPLGTEVEIVAPRAVYKDINGTDITDSVDIAPSLIDQDAEERFTALGISVNNEPLTGDPTLYRFEMTENTQVEVKWEQEYALTISSDFSNTQSTELLNGQPLAGPLASQASGSPVPAAQKHWIKRGESGNAQIDGAVVDLLAQPGLDIRYVVGSYIAYGPANNKASATADADRLSVADDGRLELAYTPGLPAVSSYAAVAGNTALTEVNLASAHGLVSGLRVRISDSPNATYDGDHIITVTGTSKFTIPVSVSALTAGGSVVKRLVDIRTARTGTVTGYAASGGDTKVTAVSHGLRTGATIVLKGTGQAAYENPIGFIVTRVDNDSFTIGQSYPALAANQPSGGSWTEITYVREFPLDDYETRQQVDWSSMHGPAGITFKWKIQYGVRVNVDDVSRRLLPKVVDGQTGATLYAGDGVFWFDPGAHLKILTAANDGAATPQAMRGWFNGDGYYFPSTGNINPANGQVQPGTTLSGASTQWIESTTVNTVPFRGLEITYFNRPVRVMWRYGTAAFAAQVILGEYVFQKDAALEQIFTRPPDAIDSSTFIPDTTVPNSPTNPGNDDLTEWDPVAGRLYPLLPGIFTVPWKPGASGNTSVDVLVTVVMPNDANRGIRGHYPHIANTPPVALDPDPDDNFAFKAMRFTNCGGAVDGSGKFTASGAGFSVLTFKEIERDGRGEPREFLRVRVVDTNTHSDPHKTLAARTVTVGSRITEDTALPNGVDRAALGTGYVINSTGKVRYNPFIYDVSKLDGIAARNVYDMNLLQGNSATLSVVDRSRLPGPVFPVNQNPNAPADQKLFVVWYDNPTLNDSLLWPYLVREYTPAWPSATDPVDRIVIASQWGSESLDANGEDQVVAPAHGEFPEATTYDPSRLQAVQIYQQPNRDAPGYNPNEEHALMAPSLRFADVSPRPPAAYALRDSDLNTTTEDANYTSDSFVLVQFFDTAVQEYRMHLYRVEKEDTNANITFASLTATTYAASTLNGEPHVNMEAGEPVIPFYPLGVAIGASPPAEIFGNNLSVSIQANATPFKQLTYWKDHKGTSWAVSGDTRSWFSASFYYPLAPDFYWPPGKKIPKIKINLTNGEYSPEYLSDVEPVTGDAVAFLPDDVDATPSSSTLTTSHVPTKVLYHADWPENPPVLKAGETLTYSGGENRADNPTTVIGAQTVETPGLPQVLAFASAKIVFDSLNPQAGDASWKTSYTARVVQALEVRRVPLPVSAFPAQLQPQTGKTRVSQGKFIFNDLPASLQKRLRYDPLTQQLEFSGFVNDRDIGANDLTAAPPAVYVLEPNILTTDDIAVLKDLRKGDTGWGGYIDALALKTRNPNGAAGADITSYFAGLNASGLPNDVFGPGLAVVPNDAFLDPTATTLPAVSYITLVENDHVSLGGSPVTPHIIKVDRRKRYRGSIKTVLSDNVFDENIVLRHTGDFGGKSDNLYFEWYYRPDDGSLNVPPPDLIPAGQTNPWKLFPDPTGQRGKARQQITLKGNPNAPEALIADTWWFCRYRHDKDKDGANGNGSNISGSNWGPNSTLPAGTKKYDWAGAGNNDPFHDFDLDGIPDYRAQLASGWIKRVLDAVNPYEARIRDFEGENPSTVASMIQQFGPRFEGPVALNPNKDVIENVGLIELYETVLKRARDLTIDLSRPVSTPAIANALQLASTRISDFYTLLGNEAYTDAQDPTIGFGSDSVEYGSMAPAVFAFQNQQQSLLGEELSLLRGVDDFFARPVYNRLFWNFTRAEGEAAYALNYNMSDVNLDGFIDEDDAMKLYPMGHGDAWGHYLTAVRKQYALLNHPFFNWVSRSESYNIQDIVVTVDFLDERKFAATAAAKAKAGAEIVRQTYREKYVDAPEAQWQGYTDTNPDRAWGVDEWSRRAGQGAYFDWITANALLPSEHPNTTLEGVRKVDRENNSDIAVISANLSAIQTVMDQSNRGQNPLGLSRNALVFDIDPTFLEVGSTAQIGTRAVQGLLHFDQIYERALKMLENAQAIWDNANEPRNMLRQVGNSEAEFRNSTYQEDVSYRNQLIQIFGTPHEGNIGSGKIYPPGYNGPDLALYMYVPVRQINKSTVPGPTVRDKDNTINSGFASFDTSGNLTGGDLFQAFQGSHDGSTGTGAFGNDVEDVDSSVRQLFTATFSSASNLIYNNDATAGLFEVNYTDLQTPKIALSNFIDKLPITAAGYTFQADPAWGARRAPGELQDLITQMLVQEAAIAEAVGAWDSLSGQIVRTIRLINARMSTSGTIQLKEEVFSRTKLAILNVIKGLKVGSEIMEAAKTTTEKTTTALVAMTPNNLPTAGLAFSPGDMLAPVDGGAMAVSTVVTTGISIGQRVLRVAELVAEIGLTAAENELNLFTQRTQRELQIKEWLKELEDLVGDEPIRRIQIFKEIQTLHALSDQYRAKLAEGGRLVDERAAFNKRVAAQTQRNRYQDMTFRVARNHALQTYRSQFDLAAKYAWLAAKAYDYETNYDDSDPGSPQTILADIVKARTIGKFDDQPRRGAGGLCEALATLKANYESQRGQLGLNTPQRETGKMSLRTQMLRILPKGSLQPQQGVPVGEFPSPGMDSDSVWKAELNKAKVADLWDVPEFRYYCRPFAPATDAAGGHVPQPGLVFRFGSEIMAGKNFFGKPLSGGDQAFDPTNYTTKIVGIGVWFSDYLSEDVLNDLAVAPRCYLIPAGSDIMRVPRSANPNTVRVWDVLDQSIPVPLPALHATINQTRFVPLLDTLNGPSGEVRKFSSFRAYHNGEAEIDFEELVTDSRLIGRSVWNTEWMLIVPGQALNADPDTGLERFIEQVSDISIVFETYGLSGG